MSMKKKNNVINFPKKYIGKRKVKLPNKDVIRVNEDMGFADQLTEAIIVQMVHVLSDNDIKVSDTQFVKDLSFVIESIKSAVYIDLNLNNEIQPLVDKFMVQEKDEKGQTNTIFKMELIQKFLKAAEKKK